jgi:UDP-N-acetylmuramate--alanine ligase
VSTIFRGRVNRVHFIGIGGIGMSGIAELLIDLGFEVHGSDLKASDTVERLRERGAVVHVGHDEANVAGADVVVTSTAVSADNPEVRAARRDAVPVIPRAEMLAELMRLKHGVAIAGSHGKTTTTSLVAAVLNHAGIDPTVVIGGKVNQLGSNARLGRGDYLVAEADESDGSFLKLSPTLAVVTNLDLEHVDYWTGGLDQLKGAFIDFLNRLPFYGLGVVCIDEENVQQLLPEVTRRVVTYGRSKQADYQARDVEAEGLVTRFSVHKRGRVLGDIALQLTGEHNVLNALAAVAVADELEVSFADAKAALEDFEGVQRRFTHRGDAGGVTVIDDYGHHPVEVRATLAGARRAYKGRRIVVLFQPHRYSRTAALKDDFGRAFNDADVVRVADVYAAGEAPIEGADAPAIADSLVAHGHHDALAIGALDDAVAAIADELAPGDVLITLGAGDVTRAGPALLARLSGGGDEGDEA